MPIVTDTQVKRIDLTTPNLDLVQMIRDQCEVMAGIDYRLAASFEASNQVILIFQK